MNRLPVHAYRDEESGELFLVYRKSRMDGCWKPWPKPSDIVLAIRALLDGERNKEHPRRRTADGGVRDRPNGPEQQRRM